MALVAGCASFCRGDVVSGEQTVVLQSYRERLNGKSPLIIYCHTRANLPVTEIPGFAFYNFTILRLLAASGFIVVGSLLGSDKHWGNALSVTDMEAVRAWAVSYGAKNAPIGIYACSMGFAAAANYWHDYPSNVGRVFAGSPVANLSSMVANYGAELDAAYGGNFAANGASRSPHLVVPTITGAGPKLRVHYSHLDATVPPSDITSMCSAVSATCVDVEASAASSPSGHTSYLAPQNDHAAILHHFAALL